MPEYGLIEAGAAAILGGAVNALAGGGTLITFAALLALGLPPVAANVTNTVALCPGYLGGALAQFRELGGKRRRLYVFGLAGALGGVVGGALLLNTGEETFRTLVPYLILLAAGLLAIEEPIHKWNERRAARGEEQHASGPRRLIPVFLASIYGGYFGGGLSVILLAVLALVLTDTLTRLNALKQVIALCANVAAAIFFLFSGKVVWSVAAIMAVGALVGGGLGGLAADRVSPLMLRWLVVASGVAIFIAYFVK
jgi:uncharacterized protein